MQIRYVQNGGVLLVFPQGELKVALSVLKALNKVSPLPFIGQAISDIEADMQPKQLPMVNYHHVCHKCFRDLDERDKDSIHFINGDDEKWFHRDCPPLKDNRP